MSQRQLWALFVVASAAAAVAPIVAQWTGARINVEPVIDQGPEPDPPYVDDDDECFPMPPREGTQNGQGYAPGFAESDSEGLSAPAGG